MNSYHNNTESNKKSAEYRSLNAAAVKLDFLKQLKDMSLPGQEKPDFVFIDKEDHRIGIEHFLIDISMGHRNNSNTKIIAHKTRRLFKKYHQDIANRTDEAANEIERMINSHIKDWQNFDYSTFIKNLKRIFDSHYSRIDVYRRNSNLDSIGFLIGFFTPDATYLVSRNGESLHMQKLKNFPITTDMWRILRDALSKLDFIILDTYQTLKKKDSILLINKDTPPRLHCTESSLH